MAPTGLLRRATPRRDGSRPSAERSTSLRNSTRSRARVALVVYAVATAVFVVRYGLILQWDMLTVWMVGLLTLMTLARGTGDVVSLFRDWGLLAFFFVFYVASRGAADSLGMPVRSMEGIDRAIGFGTIPTAWLQDVIPRGAEPAPWELAFPLVYVTHFLGSFAIAAVLWWRNRSVFRQWIRRLVTLSFIGLAGYILLPTIPPWMASYEGDIAPVDRNVVRGWEYLHLETAGDAIEWGRAGTNHIAAMPSLHAGYSMLICLFLWPKLTRWGKAMLALYPTWMGFVLVATAEHWVIDVFAGWACALVTIGLWNWIEARPLPGGAGPGSSSSEESSSGPTAGPTAEFVRDRAPVTSANTGSRSDPDHAGCGCGAEIVILSDAGNTECHRAGSDPRVVHEHPPAVPVQSHR